jgi:hypothetical protein
MLYCVQCRFDNDWPPGATGYTTSMGECEVCRNGTVPCYDVPSSALPAPKTENEDKSQEKIGQKPHKKPSGNQEPLGESPEDLSSIFADLSRDQLKAVVRGLVELQHARVMRHAPPNARLTLIVRMLPDAGKAGVGFTVTNEEGVGDIISQVLMGDLSQVPLGGRETETAKGKTET